MKKMKQNSKIIYLRDFTEDDHPFGNTQGKETFRRLSDYIDNHPSESIYGISLKGIVATDASFPRESVVSIAKSYRGEKGFYLRDLDDRDIIDNWSYAALAKEQPLIIWKNDKFEIIGPKLNSSAQIFISHIYKNKQTTTSQVAHDLNLSVQNASARLKKFFQQGLVMRFEESSESGGIEFIYHAIQ